MADEKLEIFKTDLLIQADDGTIYILSKEVWTKHPLRPDHATRIKKEFTDRGVVLAKIPYEGPIPSVACYLVNLASLKIPQDEPPPDEG